ncbi:MAG TPA: endonuclease/exonuclease/phosphatase family protein [Bryobacteraceae bacterium]|nr:endonuclease/exonuclease/phosphatase family protein [Bryobacteraceae bacterium]
MRTFRIATYNIHKGRGMDGRVRIERILRVLREVEADIVTLQEVINHEERSPEEHQACYLAEKLGYFYSMGATRKHRDGVYGNVTLSRWKFDLSRHIDLSVAGREPRGALRTDIRVGDEILHVFNVHLGTAVRERRAQARLIDQHLLKALDVAGHRIVMGDFNDWNHGLVTKTLSSEFHLTDLAAHLPRTRTYPALLPLVHLDHIYLDHELRIDTARFHRNRLSLMASDHLPLVAEVAFRKSR